MRGGERKGKGKMATAWFLSYEEGVSSFYPRFWRNTSDEEGLRARQPHPQESKSISLTKGGGGGKEKGGKDL